MGKYFSVAKVHKNYYDKWLIFAVFHLIFAVS